MSELDKIIFVGRYGNSREPMAVGIMNDLAFHKDTEVLARGMVVQFPEPMNQKAEAVLISNGIEIPGFSSKQLMESEITENTLIFTMEEKQRLTLLEMFPNVIAEHIQTLPHFVGEELDIVDPYGGTIQTYGLCFENLKKSIKKLVEIIYSEEVLWANKEEEVHE